MAEQELEAIRDALLAETAASGGMLFGARAGNVIRRVVRTFSPRPYGYPTLRAFIAAKVPELRVAEDTGPDVVYALREDVEISLPPVKLSLDKIWQHWTSPHSMRLIAIGRSDGSARLLANPGGLAPEEFLLRPLPVDAHRMIATAFLAEHALDGELAAELKQIVEVLSRDYWQRWSARLKLAPREMEAWTKFRRTQLRGQLERALEVGGVANARAYAQSIHDASRPARHEDPSANAGVTPAPVQLASDARSNLIALIQSVVARMSDEELRDLKLPVGVVVDVYESLRR